jgi:hypothetical protein
LELSDVPGRGQDVKRNLLLIAGLVLGVVDVALFLVQAEVEKTWAVALAFLTAVGLDSIVEQRRQTWS